VTQSAVSLQSETTTYMKTWIIIGLCVLVWPLAAQKSKSTAPPANGDNIVPNPGFERFDGPPIGWSYRGAFFGQVVKYWFSATTASPDVYGQGIKVPSEWAAKGFGKQKPRTGQSMAGLTLYGCENGKPHCREYIEIQLAEPLVEGQTYQVEYWVRPLERSMYINNLGAYFSINPIERKTDEILIRNAQMRATDIVKPAAKDQWTKVSGSFKATYEAEHILIGNFSDDANTKFEMSGPDGYNYAYYYVDDVVVKKVPPYAVVPVKPDDLTRNPLIVGQTVPLKNIYFAFDKDELLPRSFVELHKLLKIMRDNPTMQIEIVGHTDSLGQDKYNLDLSRRRAQAVATFLTTEGIAAKRMKARGEGEAKPIAPNDTDEGRAQNRRVEFVVTKK
jgi:OmpA-OmpF porin, OOP family